MWLAYGPLAPQLSGPALGKRHKALKMLSNQPVSVRNRRTPLLATAQDTYVSRNEPYDLCILDINLPDGPGTNLLSDSSLSERLPPLCLLLSGTSDRDEILMALHAGANAFISKSVEFSDLMKAINLLIDLPESPREPLFWDQNNNQFVRVAEAFPKGTVLSPREREVFALMRRGMQDKEIAFALKRSIHMIRVQVRSIRRKRGVTRRGEANQCP